MWSQLVLACLVAVAYASENPAWNEKSHYVYHVQGRSLAGLTQISNVYSGIVFQAQLEVQPKSDGNLAAKLTNSQYAKVHAKLEEGWETELPQSEVSFQPLRLSDKPFEIVMEGGVVHNLIVNKQIKNWEANMIKSVVSQLQLDTKAKNHIQSTINIFTQEDSNTAVFKTMEETVTGVSETLYEIHPYPEYVLQSRPWVAPLKSLNEEGEVIEILKNKNFTHSPQLPSYHVGLQGIEGYQPGNKIGDYLTRSSVSQAVITGSLEDYTIQSSVTCEEISLAPTFVNKQRGALNSKLNLTLAHVSQKKDETQYQVENGVEVGVVYAYDDPYSTSNSPRNAKEYDHGVAPDSAESSPRSSRSVDNFGEEEWHQDKPRLGEAPPSPLLPFTVGHDGQSIKKQQNIIETVRKLAQEVGQESTHAKQVLDQQTVGKFVTLTSLVRIMDQNEVEQVSQQLFSQKSPGWLAYRDAVAQAGTGPAITIIKKWIESRQVSDLEAAQIISTAANAARQPTEEYMKFFNDMIQDESFMAKPLVNESALLSYTTLVRQVYGDKQESKGKFPIYSYGSFRTSRGQEFVKKTVIPYLTRQLNTAINKGDTRKTHVYIRALGNVGQQEILEAFEPYLEGQRKASHFQRVLMVLAMDKLVKSNPRVARSVLYKIYQNSGEAEHVRAVAVFQLMRTDPSPAMLQRMASYTNVDPSHYVNAAVKSAIQTAAWFLDAPEHNKLREAAKSAEALLTNVEYGAQYSQNFLLSYAEQEGHFVYQQDVNTLGGFDHAVPRGINYMLQRKLGGLSQQLVSAQAIVSSMEDLINVLQQQTKEYQNEQQEKKAQTPNPWSSENLAKILNLQNEQREQLEGSIFLQLGYIQSIWSFDNHTLEQWVSEMQHMEEELRKGKRSEYSKMFNSQEVTVALPTVLGLPFIHTYDRPILLRIQSELKAHAEPQISNGQVLQKPDTVKGDFDINVILSARVQSEFGIFTPFDHQRYSAGYHKNVQAVLPLTGKVDLNLRRRQLKVEFVNPGNQENVRLAHYSSWPFTAQNDIYSPKPTLKIIHSDELYQQNFILGDKATGIGLYFQIKSDERIDRTFVYEKFRQHSNPLGAMLQPWTDEKIQYVHFEAGIDGSKSSTEQVIFRLGYQRAYQENNNDNKFDSNTKVTEIPTFAEDPEKRQMEFVDRLGYAINDAEVVVGDATVEFNGQNKIKYHLTAGSAKSNVDPHGRFMAYLRKADKQHPEFSFYVQGLSTVPNTNGLNLDFAMQLDPTSKYNVQALLRHEQRLSRAEAKIHLSKSKDRVQYIQHQQDYKICKEQMRQGNSQLPICAEVAANANLLDQFAVQMTYSDMHPQIINATYKAYSIWRHKWYPRVEENIVDVQNSNTFDMKGKYSPDLEFLNVTIGSQFGRAELKNARLGPWARALFVPHPVFHTSARLQGEILKEDTYRPICVVDQTYTSTFDNKSYPSTLSHDWTVALQYVPRRPSPVPNKPELSVEEQLRQTVESYVVYVRAEQAGSPKKQVQLFVQMPETQGKIAKIALQASTSNRQPQVLVNDQNVKYTTESSSDFYNGNIQIYGLPNQEVKVEVYRAFYLIFNGKTLKITVVNSKFRDSARGLCGTFTGEPETDFATPQDCIIHDPAEFLQQYTVGSDTTPRKHGVTSNNPRCFHKKVYFANYISNEDAGRSSDNEARGGDDCTGHLTRYEEKDGEICFTIRPLPFCKSSCSPLHMNVKHIDVHCLAPSATTAFWRSQIDKKINVDFTMMQATGKLGMPIPARCLPN